MKAVVYRRYWVFLQLAISISVSAATHTLTLGTNGNGVVNVNPNAPAYPENSTVTLTATASGGWQFNGWSGSISGTLNPTNVLMSNDKNITANFVQIPIYLLTVSVVGGGSVAPGTQAYYSNTVVQLTATPSNGWNFSQWSGDASGSVNPLTVTMSGNKTVAAQFIQPVSIGADPQDVTSLPGGPANFSVTAAGSGPLSYAWLFNGAPITGASNSTFSIANVQPADGGAYRVIVSNPYSSATSAVATLTVTCPGTNVVFAATDAALRAAIAIGGNIRLCFSGTIVLNSTISVTNDTILDASGVFARISGNNAVRLFDVSTNTLFALNNLTLMNGAATGALGGAAILNRGGAISLTACVLSQNCVRDASGGALAILGGSLSVIDSVFTANTGRGSISIPQKSIQGGAIASANAVLQITDSLFQSNSLASDSTPSGSGFESTAQLDGGALAISSGTATLTRVRFLTNRVVGGFTRNGVIPGVGGGAVYNRGTLTVMDSTFAGNEARGSGGYTVGGGGANGGALKNSGTAHLNRNVFVANVCRGGDGRDTVGSGFGGTDARGGAISSGELFATNCTFALNAAFGGASGGYGGTGGNAYGGAIESSSSATILVNVTLATNLANVPRPYSPNGGGLSLGMNLAATTNVPVTVRNSLLAGTSNNVWGEVLDGGYNISSDGTANFSSGTSFNFTDPRLLFLANNGGPTPTMALSPDSPAIDWAPTIGAPATDQRGFGRPSGSGVDLGAFELNPDLPVLRVRRAGTNAEVSFLAQAGISYRLESSPDLLNWQTEETIGASVAEIMIARIYSATGPQRFYRLTLNL